MRKKMNMSRTPLEYIAIDQYGQVFYGLKHPRKDLMERLQCKHADKMYIGDGEHIGYVIKRHWLRLYQPLGEKLVI